MTVKFTSIPPKRLAETISPSATTFRLNNILSWEGVDLTSSDVGTSVYAVFRNTTNTAIEIMEIDGTTIASDDITITRRGLSFDGNLTTEDADRKLEWIKSETIVELGADAPQLFQYLKEYIDGVAVAGAPNASLTAKGLVESATTAEIDANTASGSTGADLSVRPDQLNSSKYGTRLPSAGEKEALAAGSTFGTPSTSNKYITQDYNSSATGLPVVTKYETTGTSLGSSTTQFDITNTSGSTYRYTYDGTGTDPNFSAANNPVGSLIYFNCQNFSAGNNGLFVVTASGTNYVEVSNASGVGELNKTVGTGSVQRQSAANGTYTKPTGLKYIVVEQCGGGSDGQSASGGVTGGAGGSSGGYAKKLIAAGSLSANEYFMVGAKKNDTVFRIKSSSPIQTTGAKDGSSSVPGAAGTATGGDININGNTSVSGVYSSAGSAAGSAGAGTPIGIGGGTSSSSPSAGVDGTGYGSGGGGGGSNGSTNQAGGSGRQGVIIITEYFS